MALGVRVMAPLSTGGPVSSRTFDARIMKGALQKLPSSQRADVYALVTALDERTGIGYYAAMDFVANLGLFLVKTCTKST